MDKCQKCGSNVAHGNGRYYCEDPYCDWSVPDRGQCLLDAKEFLQKMMTLYPDLKQAIQLMVKGM